MTLFYSRPAIEDLRRLRSFVAERNPAAARRIAAELLAQLERLETFPRIGRPVERAPDPDSVCDLVFGDYVVRHSVHESVVVVLRIWHHFEDRDGS